MNISSQRVEHLPALTEAVTSSYFFTMLYMGFSFLHRSVFYTTYSYSAMEKDLGPCAALITPAEPTIAFKSKEPSVILFTMQLNSC